jgi:DNA-directed RNA polymerase subunit RPC12/RpoP
VKGKAKPNAPERVAQVVANGEVELAIGATPDLSSAKGVQFVGLLPAELQNWFVNTAGVSAAAKQPDAAKALCALGKDREGLKSVRECVYSRVLDLETLVWTRGRSFPISYLESRLRCPRCGSRQVRLIFVVPPTPMEARAAVRG